LKMKREKLESLPEPPPSQPNIKLLNLVSGFCKEVDEYINGKEGYEVLRRSCRTYYGQFKVKIASTHPHFVPFRKHSKEAKSGKWEISLSVEDDHPIVSELSNVEKVVMDLDDVNEHIER
jgi:hypothetical protein